MADKFNRSELSGLSAQHKGLLVGAGALVLFGLTRKSKAGVALATAGGVLAYKSARGEVLGQHEDVAKTVFLVNATPEQAYRLWRDFESLPKFMSHLKSVQVLDDRRSAWVALGPMEAEVQWTAEITEDREGQVIAWRSEPGSAVTTSGRVEFKATPQGRGTMVTAEVHYTLPTGPVAKALISIMGKNPEFVVREDVRRFKSLLEAGEAPTTIGQPHGPRGIHGRVERVLFREGSNHPEPQAADRLSKSA